ncbi:hypothetical protein [Pedobacter hartonius]|uniref:Uncharacterized protein n=1 Tax=Pedobacter hartonius TaxID=425514 RepID=A0A1H4FPS0_9SPHI|nr:hypothetical protein [Pedobacter hartonius]SEA99306.1 hypothetical protein SAMN05443550_10856 [Pedobacter hartonius]
MKKFILKLIPFLAIPVIIIAINFKVDPANLFNGNYEMGIANYLTAGYNVTNVVNYDERLLQKHFIESMVVPPTEIVLGSSRIMQLHKTNFNEPNFINNGVSGATIEDEMAIYDLYEKKGYKIKKVILDLDPWMLNDNHNQTRWRTLENGYSDLLSRVDKKSPVYSRQSFLYKYKKYSELISVSYFKTSIHYLINGINNNYTPTKQGVNDGFTRLTDGSIFYDLRYRNASAAEIALKANECITEDPVYSLGGFKGLSLHYQRLLFNFVEYMQGQGVEVEFYLSPFHPVVYSFFMKNRAYHNVLMAEEYFRALAVKQNIKVYGSYNPDAYKFDNTFFYDGLHCNEKAVRLLLSKPSTQKRESY